MAMTTKNKQSKGPAGMTEQELKDVKSKKIKKTIRGGGKDLKVLENIKKLDSMKYTPPTLTKEEALEEAIKRLLIEQGPAKVTFDPSDKESMKNFKKRALLNQSAKGGMIKKYKAGGSVKKNKMATTKGWGASRKT